ncbi:MAG TPA: FAD-dependent oxidoreductase [Pyrinomonadaceae bacterium]|nr:FAD-dependent oxidoreductase [Pyrinomonadaceae bacterium]
MAHILDVEAERRAEAVEVPEVRQTTVCVVGGGPGGVVLALLLARAGVAVELLEAHEDFDRDFRGDTIHTSVMELLDELGLAERLLELRHTKLHTGTFMTPGGPVNVVDFRRLKTRFPYITMLPQRDFLAFLVAEAKRYENFRLTMGARVEELVRDDGGVVRGVRYESDEGRTHEVRATLTVGADGRSSRVRHLAGFEPFKTSPPIDVLWFRLPRREGDPAGVLGQFGGGMGVVMLDRLEEWQVGFIILKGSYRQVRAEGLEALRRKLSEIVPLLADRVEHLKEWKQVAMLSVESSRVPRWFEPGLLLIGDAAHVMSPVGGVGINYAIQDAVVAANVLTEPLRRGELKTEHLREVQHQREWPTRVIQAVQTQIQNRIVAAALKPGQQFNLPLLLRILLKIPYLRDLPARIIAFGVRPVHVKK